MPVKVTEEQLDFMEPFIANAYAADPLGRDASFIDRFLGNEIKKVAFEHVQSKQATCSDPSRPVAISLGFQGSCYKLDIPLLRQNSYALYERYKSEDPGVAGNHVKSLLSSIIDEYTQAQVREGRFRQHSYARQFLIHGRT